GPLAAAAFDAAATLEARGVRVTGADPRWLCPIPPALGRLARTHKLVVTVEDGGRVGGFGSHFAQALQDNGVSTPIRSLGLPRAFLEQGGREDILRTHGLDAAGIAATVAHLYPPLSNPASPRRPRSALDVPGHEVGPGGGE